MFLPGTRRYFHCPLILVTAFASDNVDNAAGGIRTIHRSTGSFNDFDFFNIRHANQLVQIHHGTSRRRRAIPKTGTCRVVYTAPIYQHDNTGIPVNGHAVVIGIIPVLTATVSSIGKCYARNAFNSVRNVMIMALFNFFPSDNFHITACTVVRLFCYRIAEFVLRLRTLDNHCVQRIGV